MSMVDDVLERIEPEIQLYTTPEKDVYVGYQSDWGWEVVSTRSTRFRNWIQSWVRDQTGKAVGKDVCSSVVDALDAQAMFDASLEQRQVYTRVGWHEPSRTLYINLANRRQQVVRITAGKDPEVVQQGEVPLVFYHADNARELPVPQAPADGVTLDGLMRDILPPQATRRQRILMTAWLVGALHPTGPYPILALGGEPGSAKSFTSRLLRRVIDPVKPDLLHGVMDGRNLAIAARHQYCLAFDNLSKLSKAQSDALCRLATGAGIARRSLYTDSDLVALDVKRPVLVNSIGELVTEADLLDRSIVLHLPRLSGDDRKLETAMWATFDAHLPYLLWFLYRAVGVTLGRLDNVELPGDGVPRMMDFAAYVMGAEEALGWEPGAFMQAYDSSRGESMTQAVTASFPAQALICWMQRRERDRRRNGAPVAWRGSAQELHTQLETIVHEHAKGAREADWPRKAPTLSRHLQTVSTPLRRLGLDLEVKTEGKARLRYTYVTPSSESVAWQTFPTFAGRGLAEERRSDDEPSFREAYASSDPVTTANRRALLSAGYGVEHVQVMTNAFASELLQAYAEREQHRAEAVA